jgi:hypothetical protein
MDLIAGIPECETTRKDIKDKCGDPVEEEKAKCPNPTALDAAKKEHKTACGLPEGPARDADQAAATLKVHKAHEDYAVAINDNKCTKALQCALVSYRKGRKAACCSGSTPDHLVPASQFGEGRGLNHPSYSAAKAPCMCATGGAQTATHGLLGKGRTDYMVKNGIPVNDHAKSWTIADSCKCGASSAAAVTGCDQGCLEAQLKKGHEDMGVKPDEPISTRKETVDRDLTAFENRIKPPATAAPAAFG